METSSEENQLTLGMVTRALKLSKLQIRTLFNVVIQQPLPPENQLIPDNLLTFLIVADLTERLQFLKPEQRTLILSELWRDVLSDSGTRTKLTQVLFADGRYCVWTGQNGFLDLESGEWITEPEHPVMESIGYNLNELYRREKLRIEKRSGLHVKKYNAGSVEEPRDIRVGAADDVSGHVWDGMLDVEPDDLDFRN